MTTTTGTSAATEPLTVINAVRPAQRSIISTSTRARLSPACAIRCWPAQVVTAVASSASLTTKSDAMKMTVGSPNPARDWSRSSTPVAHSESATPSATIATGTRSHTKIATTAPDPV